MVQAIGLDNLDFGMEFVCVARNTVINMPNKQASAREIFVVSCKKPILDKEVLLAVSITIGPKSMRLESGLDISKRDLVVFGFGDSINPSLVQFAPWYI